MANSTTNEHTPTPWEIVTWRGGGNYGRGRQQYVNVESIEHGAIARLYEPAGSHKNAEHIVRCVNVHDQLVEKLEFWLYRATRDQPKSVPDHPIVADTKAVLAKAKGASDAP